MDRDRFWEKQKVTKKRINVLQINLGNRCNQVCSHCHIDASPTGNNIMDQETADSILQKIAASDIKHIEFTGGAPELNHNLQRFIEDLAVTNKKITVRTNLTVLDMPEYAFYCELYRHYKIKLIASLPCYLLENVDQQRGVGVYTKSIAVLQKLNALGYGTNGLCLDLVYNPTGDFLPPEQTLLQRSYSQFLEDNYHITFNSIIPITNAPVGRFKEILSKQNKLNNYRQLLRKSYNQATVDKLMCRALVAINYKGYVYDCDFNLALDKKIKGYELLKFWEIDLARFNPEITFDEHCYACTAGNGSSCHGALVGTTITAGINSACCSTI